MLALTGFNYRNKVRKTLLRLIQLITVITLIRSVLVILKFKKLPQVLNLMQEQKRYLMVHQFLLMITRLNQVSLLLHQVIQLSLLKMAIMFGEKMVLLIQLLQVMWVTTRSNYLNQVRIRSCKIVIMQKTLIGLMQKLVVKAAM